MEKQGVYLGPRLRRLRRDLGLTQADMAADLEISASYIALMERNQRPVTAETLLRLAKAYKIDFSDFTSSSGPDLVARLQSAIRDPILSDIDFGPLEIADVAHSFPGFAEAMLRLHTAYKEEQFALADKRQHDGGNPAGDPVADVRSFLSARRNFFPVLVPRRRGLPTELPKRGDCLHISRPSTKYEFVTYRPRSCWVHFGGSTGIGKSCSWMRGKISRA